MQLEPDKIIGVNVFAYPNEYPKLMTDCGMYAFFACKHSLSTFDAGRSHHGAVKRGFRKKVTCLPTIPSTFTLNVGTIPSTPATESHLFQASQSSKRLNIQNANSLWYSTFLFIVWLLLLRSQVIQMKQIYCIHEPPHADTPAPIKFYQHHCSHHHHHNLIVVSCTTIHDGIGRGVFSTLVMDCWRQKTAQLSPNRVWLFDIWRP